MQSTCKLPQEEKKGEIIGKSRVTGALATEVYKKFGENSPRNAFDNKNIIKM